MVPHPQRSVSDSMPELRYSAAVWVSSPIFNLSEEVVDLWPDIVRGFCLGVQPSPSNSTFDRTSKRVPDLQPGSTHTS